MTDPDSLSPVWICADCGSDHPTPAAALNCCGNDYCDPGYLCPLCSKPHPDEAAALDCCDWLHSPRYHAERRIALHLAGQRELPLPSPTLPGRLPF